MNALCPCGYDMPSPVAADMCARECDDADRETRQAARAASRRLRREWVPDDAA